MRALVPGVHFVELRVGLVDHEYWPFGAVFKVRAGHDHSDFDEAVLHRAQARHLAIEPDEIFIGFG